MECVLRPGWMRRGPRDVNLVEAQRMLGRLQLIVDEMQEPQEVFPSASDLLNAAADVLTATVNGVPIGWHLPDEGNRRADFAIAEFDRATREMKAQMALLRGEVEYWKGEAQKRLEVENDGKNGEAEPHTDQ